MSSVRHVTTKCSVHGYVKIFLLIRIINPELKYWRQKMPATINAQKISLPLVKTWGVHKLRTVLIRTLIICSCTYNTLPKFIASQPTGRVRENFK